MEGSSKNRAYLQDPNDIVARLEMDGDDIGLLVEASDLRCNTGMYISSEPSPKKKKVGSAYPPFGSLSTDGISNNVHDEGTVGNRSRNYSSDSNKCYNSRFKGNIENHEKNGVTSSDAADLETMFQVGGSFTKVVDYLEEENATKSGYEQDYETLSSWDEIRQHQKTLESFFSREYEEEEGEDGEDDDKDVDTGNNFGHLRASDSKGSLHSEYSTKNNNSSSGYDGYNTKRNISRISGPLSNNGKRRNMTVSLPPKKKIGRRNLKRCVANAIKFEKQLLSEDCIVSKHKFIFAVFAYVSLSMYVSGIVAGFLNIAILFGIGVILAPKRPHQWEPVLNLFRYLIIVY